MSDIRYVASPNPLSPPSPLRGFTIRLTLPSYAGILHEINSEESTVSLQNVKSFGSEGRRGNPDDEVPASDQIYDYIVFRGTDVKDLRIDHPPEPPKQSRPPVMPNDPAIVGVSLCPFSSPAR